MTFRSKNPGAPGWSELEKFRLSPQGVKEIGDFMVQTIQQEAMKDLARLGQLPDSPKFFKSFYWEEKDGEFFMKTTWPWIERFVEGRDPYPMDWLTRPRGVHKVPIIRPDGTVIIRSAPLTTANAWIHPAIAKHTFVARTLKKTKEKVKEVVAREFTQRLIAGDPSK